MGNEHTEYSGEIDVPVEAIRIVDPSVLAKLPQGTIITSVAAHGASFWTRTAKLDAFLNDRPKEYFLKTSHGDRGKGMMSGEFTSMSLMYEANPDLVPKPIAWGTYTTIPDVHFFLCNFHNMTDDLPDLHSFPAMLAKLHRNGSSPNGSFGFPVKTYHGQTPIDHGWSDTWEEYFKRTTTVLLRLEQESQGLNKELLDMADPFLNKVIPRLLRPLETGGRSIKPCLIHGDLWYGNATMDGDSELPIIFDAACFYAHNEYDLGVWRATWNKIGKPYITRYHKHFPISPPEEDHDDRNALYATRVGILDSILYKGNSGYREKLIIEMKKLVEKFPGGYEGAS
ncbi:uncharacterized protein K444DRAFT_560745 [Hyaloscypha bicolor E]|uniref:protein-ribulosamine 3-kinase n=1 Tax=Hyaloscypha bicolor E TaxID=1095630 RepID=A0A2J6TCJ7_9HELO|nr:uncharacterized protein K444DRAFT_560745 [Hyaloscypha bicolor E]PMD60750.1 hypothetical protein K444DRAFT_560745 [Hyaloscypha bicolor E]